MIKKETLARQAVPARTTLEFADAEVMSALREYAARNGDNIPDGFTLLAVDGLARPHGFMVSLMVEGVIDADKPDDIKPVEVAYSKVTVKHGDVIVISCPGQFLAATRIILSRQFKELFLNSTVVFLEDGITFGVVEGRGTGPETRMQHGSRGEPGLGHAGSE